MNTSKNNHHPPSTSKEFIITENCSDDTIIKDTSDTIRINQISGIGTSSSSGGEDGCDRNSTGSCQNYNNSLNYNQQQQQQQQNLYYHHQHNYPDDTASNSSTENPQETTNNMRIFNQQYSNYNYPHQQQQYNNNNENYNEIQSSSGSYFRHMEPIFRPPSSSYYSHNYPPHNIDYNSQIFGSPPQPPLPVASNLLWYNQQQQQQQQHYQDYTYHSHESHKQKYPRQYHNQSSSNYTDKQHQHMLNMLHYSNSNGREARNRAEKQRRDKLNGSIADLATMVPHVAESPRRVDKTAVLRYSAHGLRIRYVFGRMFENSANDNSKNGLILTDSLMKLLDGFLLTVTCRGQIVLISPSVEQHLGHCQTDLFGQNILNITHPDDHTMLKNQLIPTDLESLFDIQPEEENGEPRPRTAEEEMEIDRRLSEDRRNFTLRLSRATPRSEPTTYEIVKIDGCFRRADSAPRGVKSSTYPSGLQLIRRARGRDDSIPLHSISGNDIVLVAMARIIKPPKIMDRLLEANYYEYKTRHLIDGRIIQCDQRISLVAGYMTDEVIRLSPFTFMHQDDVRWVIVALRQMYDSNSSYGESCYRLLTRTGRFIYLRTRGYLEIDKDTNKVHSFVCVNTLVNEEEGKRRVQEMKNKFSIIINTKIPESVSDAPACDNPQQLEKAVIYLIQNLQKTADDDNNDDTDSYKSIDGGSGCGSIRQNKINSGSHKTDTPLIRQTKSPPLSLIAPEASSIKSSITESVRIVNVTAANNFRLNKIKNSPISEYQSNAGDDADDDDSNSSIGNIYYPKKQRTISIGSCNTDKSNDDYPIENCSQQKQKQNRPSVLYKSGNIIQTTLTPTPIKEEIFEYNENDCRVPPLPNSSGYYEMTNYNLKSPSSDIKIIEQIKSPPSTISSTTTTIFYTDNRICQPTSVLKRIRTSTNDINASENNMAVKRRNNGISVLSSSGPSNNNVEDSKVMNSAKELINPHEELKQVLSNSFVQINRSLSKIENATTELREHCSTYPIVNSQNQLEEIIEEHHEQKELLENIQNEYVAHFQGHTIITTTNKPLTQNYSVPITTAATTRTTTTTTTSDLTTLIHPAGVIIEKTDDISRRRKFELKPR